MIRVDVPAWQGAQPAERVFRLRVTGTSAYHAYGYMAFIQGPSHNAVGRVDVSNADPQFEFRRSGDQLRFADAFAGNATTRTLTGSSFLIDLQAWQPKIEEDVTCSLRVSIEEITDGAPEPELKRLRFVEGEVDTSSGCAEYDRDNEWIVDAPLRIRFR